MILGDTKKPSFKVSKNDNYNTPVEAWEFILNNMQQEARNKIIWSPFYHDGSLIKNLKDLYLNLIHENKDFFTYEPDKFDYIIDNPPFSCKKEILQRCLKLNKPFALLLPLDTLERHYIKHLFNSDTNKIQVLIPRKRYDFMGTSHRRIPFKSVWLTYDFPLIKKDQLIFEES